MSDTELLDYLQSMLDEENYTGNCILRWSGIGRGFRLHETNLKGATPDVREAIRKFAESQS